MGRVRYATRNIIFGFLGSGATTLLNFILRQVFITHLGDTLLGVQDLYSEILTMLSLAELGVGTALNYSLYGPVARGEREKIKSYMQLYKKAYRTIAMVIAVIGLALVPFLPWIVKNADYLTLRQLRVYYLLFLFNTVTTPMRSRKTISRQTRMPSAKRFPWCCSFWDCWYCQTTCYTC